MFDSHNTRYRHMNSDLSHSSSSSYWSDDENKNEFEHEQLSYYPCDGIRTRVVWITNYATDENFPISVPADDPLVHMAGTFSSATELESMPSNENDDISLIDRIRTVDLTKLNLDDLLLLLHRLQLQTTKNSAPPSASAISSSSSSSSSGFIERKPSFRRSSQIPTCHSFSPTLSNTVHSSFSTSINRRRSSFTLSNIADVPKQLTTTLAKPISSFQSHNSKHIHSPNDVVNKLLQSFNVQHDKHHQQSIKRQQQQHSPSYTYQESQQHKANLLSNLLSSNSSGSFGRCTCPNNFYP